MVGRAERDIGTDGHVHAKRDVVAVWPVRIGVVHRTGSAGESLEAGEIELRAVHESAGRPEVHKPVAVKVVPTDVGRRAGVRVRAPREGAAGLGVVATPTTLQGGAAVTEEVVGEAQPRADVHWPIRESADLGVHRKDCVRLELLRKSGPGSRRAALHGDVAIDAVETDADVQRQAVADGPGVLRVERPGVQPLVGGPGSPRDVDLRRDAVLQNAVGVAALELAGFDELARGLSTDLEVVGTARRVQVVGQRTVELVPVVRAPGFSAPVGVELLEADGVDDRNVVLGAGAGVRILVHRDAAVLGIQDVGSHAHHAAETEVEKRRVAQHPVVGSDVVVRPLVLEPGQLVGHRGVGGIPTVEPLLPVALERHRKPVVVTRLQGELPAQVPDPVVVDRVRTGVVGGNADFLVVVPVPVGGEEPRLVTNDRPAESAVDVDGLGDRVGARFLGLALKAGGVVERDGITRELVSAGLHDHVHQHAAGVRLGAVSGGLEVELLVHREAVVLHRPAAIAAGPIHLESVDLETLHARGRTEDLHAVLLHAVAAADVHPAGHHPRNHAGHDPRVPSGGDGLKQLALDVRLDGGAADIHDRGVAGDRNGFFNPGNPHGGVHLEGAGHADPDAFLDDGLESRETEADGVVARRESRVAVRAARTGGGAAGRDQRGAVDRNGHAGEHRSLFIGRGPGDRPRLLSKRRDDRKKRERDQNCGLTHGEPPHEAWFEGPNPGCQDSTGENARWQNAAAP